MILDAIDGWDDYPRRIFDRETTIRGIAEWIDAESSVMPYSVLHCDGVRFRVAVRDYKEQDLILRPMSTGIVQQQGLWALSAS